MVIESIDNKKIKDLRKLKEKKYRDKEGLFLIEGEHLILEAYKNNLLKEVILSEGDINLDIDKLFVSKIVINSLTDLHTPCNMIGVCKINKKIKKYGNKILMLEDVQDPGNLGAIIRSAVAFNINTIILSNNSVDLYNSKVLRSAQGMNFYINIVRKDLKEEILKLKEENYKIYGTNVNNGMNVKNVEKNVKCVIIMGNEGNGLSKELESLCDKNIYIDTNESCESLNVSVAASIILYELNN